MKKITLWVLICCLSAMFSMTVLAKEWKQDETGWWYSNDDGSYPKNEWCWITSDDGVTAYCYYFDSNGYAAINTITPDGYQVNENGAWVVNGIVQEKTLETYNTNENQLSKEEIEEAKAEAREEAIDKAKDKLYDAEDRSRSKRQKAVHTYLQALGYNTSGLTFQKDTFKYSAGFAGVGDPLYRLLRDDSDKITYCIIDYVSGFDDAESLIEAVEDYLD